MDRPRPPPGLGPGAAKPLRPARGRRLPAPGLGLALLVWALAAGLGVAGHQRWPATWAWAAAGGPALVLKPTASVGPGHPSHLPRARELRPGLLRRPGEPPNAWQAPRATPPPPALGLSAVGWLLAGVAAPSLGLYLRRRLCSTAGGGGGLAMMTALSTSGEQAVAEVGRSATMDVGRGPPTDADEASEWRKWMELEGAEEYALWKASQFEDGHVLPPPEPRPPSSDPIPGVQYSARRAPAGPPEPEAAPRPGPAGARRWAAVPRGSPARPEPVRPAGFPIPNQSPRGTSGAVRLDPSGQRVRLSTLTQRDPGPGRRGAAPGPSPRRPGAGGSGWTTAAAEATAARLFADEVFPEPQQQPQPQWQPPPSPPPPPQEQQRSPLDGTGASQTTAWPPFPDAPTGPGTTAEEPPVDVPPLNRRSATANLDQEDVHVFWDIETVRPDAACPPSRLLKAIHATLRKVGMPRVRGVNAYPDEEALVRLAGLENKEGEDDGEYFSYFGGGIEPWDEAQGDPEFRRWVADKVAGDDSPFRCPFCGTGKKWTHFTALRKHWTLHSKELQKARNRAEALPRHGGLRPGRADYSDTKVAKYRAAKEAMHNWMRPFHQKRHFERRLRSAGQKASVKMPLPPKLGKALVRDAKALLTDDKPANLCLVSNDPQYKELVTWAKQRGWFVTCITSSAALKLAADMTLPMTALLEAGFQVDVAAAQRHSGVQEQLRMNSGEAERGVWGEGDPEAEQEIWMEVTRQEWAQAESRRQMGLWYG